MRKISFVVIHHTAGNDRQTVAQIDKMHRNRGFGQIGYHWLINKSSGEWQIDAGRKEALIGAHAKYANTNSIGVSIAGNYDVKEIPPEGLEKYITCIVDVCLRYNITPTKRTIIMHKDCRALIDKRATATACPGRFIAQKYDRILEECYVRWLAAKEHVTVQPKPSIATSIVAAASNLWVRIMPSKNDVDV